MAANPYANGIDVGGSKWATGYDKSGNLVANTGFGQAPIYTADQFNQLQNAQFAKGSGFLPDPGTGGGAYSPGVGDLFAGTGMAGTPATFSPGNSFTIGTPDGGTQRVDYTLDKNTGYYIPSAAQGAAKDNGSWVDDLIKYGAMAASAYAGGASALGYGSAGPGAAAVGGSADVGSAVGAGAAGAAEAAPAAGGMTFDNSGLVDQIASTAATNVAPQVASDASQIAAEGASGIAADAAGGASPSWLHDVWNVVKPSPQSLVKTGANMLMSGSQQNPLAQAGAPGSQQASNLPNYGNNVDQVQMPTVAATTPRTGLVGTNMQG